MGIHQSQVAMYERCPKQYEYRYVEGQKIAPARAIRGTAFHHAEATNFKEKLTTHRDISTSSLKEAFAASYEDAFRGEVEVTFDKDDTKESLLASGLALTETAAMLLNPTIQPSMVEQKVEVPFEDGLLAGTVDLVDDRNVIRDLKTAKRKWPTTRAAYELQPPIYSLLYEGATSLPAGGFTYDVLVDGKTPTLQQIDATPTPEQVQAAKQRILKAQEGIRLGYFPYRPSSQVCSWCGYVKQCAVGRAYVNGTEV